MPTKPSEVVRLIGLILAQEALEEDAAPVVAPPVRTKALPTFDPAVSRPVSRMLKDRFDFASSIELPDERWLSGDEMARTVSDPAFQSAHRSLRRHGKGTAPNLYPDDALSLFSIVPDAPEDRTYLVWTAEDQEPELWLYSGIESERFQNLEELLRWYLE